jgi:hypothetical protein
MWWRVGRNCPTKMLKTCNDKFLVATGCMAAALAMLTAMVGCQVQQTPPMPTTSLSPVSSPTSAPVSYGVTRKAFNMMTEGMTKAQCDEIVGFSGETYKRYEYPAGSGLGTGGYFASWKKGNAEISAQFDNGSLIMKFPDNLK